jgi:phosphoribosylglycinamide formyltransferase-1
MAIEVDVRSPRIAVFAYNFPHKKTQDFLCRLFLEGFKVEAVLAADPVKLNIPPSTIRTKLRQTAVAHPCQIAERFGIPYYVVPHNDPEVISIVEKHQVELGIVAGARILKKQTIAPFSLGVINFHPGLVPEARGLDAMLWSIRENIPLGVTAHLIDEKIDAGRLLFKRKIPIYQDDTLIDLAERLNDTQIEMIGPAIQAVLEGEGEAIDPTTHYNRKMPGDLEQEIAQLLPGYIQTMLQNK